MKCPECGTKLILSGGCWVCQSCGYESCKRGSDREPHGNKIKG